jgi:pimeloyl-ACP methyl ester carboxylesterase
MAKTAEANEKCLNVSGIRLHYLDWENRGLRPILLLHGFMAHAHVWDDFALAFRAQYRVIALDQRGHGESQWCEDGAYSIYDHLPDIVCFVEILGSKDLILIGHLMGGTSALLYTACSFKRVE